MKATDRRNLCLCAAIVIALVMPAFAQVVERPRPAGWERLVPGGRFMDRFEVAEPIGDGVTTNCWGGENVKPRDIRNGIEDGEYSYWGGNIVKEEGRRYHLFVARWKESEPRGHMFWPRSEIAHAVSNKPNGDFKVVEVLGKGHNPEAFRCKDGSWAVYCIDAKGRAHLYRAKALNGPWTYERMQLDLDGKKPIDGESNFSFCVRPDGSVLAVCRGGGIWLSEDGLRPFVRKSEGSVYPNVAGRFEDPVLWRDETQYHIIVNDWLGRVAWKLVSPDGFSWTTLPGEAYTPGIAKLCIGDKIVTNDWFKFERMRVFQDNFGRVVQANFAVIDCAKKYDRGSDNHSSKNITIPVNPGRRIETFKKTRRGWEARIAKERGFSSLTDVDVDSLLLGSQSMVAFGAGVRPIATDEANGDLVVVFPSVELDSPVVEVLGREKSGRLFFATARTDGTKLNFFRHGADSQSSLQARIDELAANGGGTLTLAAGVYRTGALFFKPGVNLHLDKGATILGVDEGDAYPMRETRIEGETCIYYPALINADGCDGFTIFGEGVIDGHGLPTWKEFWKRRAEARKKGGDFTNKSLMRPRLLYVSNSKNVDVSGVTFRNSKFWTTHYYRCEDVRVHDCTIEAEVIDGVRGPSTDAIDIDVCRRFCVSNVVMNVNDDAVAVKGGKGPWADDYAKFPGNGPSEDVLVVDCTFKSVCHSCLTLGSECPAATNIVLRGAKLEGPGNLLNLKMRSDTPQHYANILVEGCEGECKTFLNVMRWSQYHDAKGRPVQELKSYADGVAMRGNKVVVEKVKRIAPSEGAYELKGLVIENNEIKEMGK